MKISKLLPFCTALFFISGVCTNVQAIPITYEFTAQVNSTNSAASTTILQSFISVGDNFTGTFSYDTAATSSAFTSTNFDIYKLDPVVYGVNLSIGTPGAFTDPTYASPSSYSVGITTDFGGTPSGAHAISVSAMSEPSPAGWPLGPRINFGLTLKDDTATVFTNNNLPDQLDLLDFNTRQIVISNVFGTESWRFDSEIISLQQVAAVPEPSILFLISISLCAFLVRRYTRRA